MAAAVHVVEGCWLRRYEGPDRANVQPARTVELSAATSPFVSSGMSALPDEVLRLCAPEGFERSFETVPFMKLWSDTNGL